MGFAGNMPDNNSKDPFPDPVFPVDPIPLSGSFQPSSSLSSFEESFIGSYECTEEPETFSTNFTLITGSAGAKKIKYTVVPVSSYTDITEIPLSADILNVGIEPDEFVANSSTIYTSRFHVTIGPNVTGESGTTWYGATYVKNPSYSFLVKVSVNGSEVSTLHDTVNVRKWCHLHSQTRNMQGGSSWDLESHNLNIRAGETKSVKLSIQNFGGGIKEIQVKDPSLQKIYPGFVCPPHATSDQLLPMPKEMNISFEKPSMTVRNFQRDTNKIIVTTTSDILPGLYHFSLTFCERNMDLDNRTSSQFPFSEKW